MPKIRSLKPDVWEHEGFGNCSIEAQAMFIGLITQADDEGRLRGAPSLLRGQLWPYKSLTDTQAEKWLGELASASLVHPYTVAGARYIALVDWSKHQRISHRRDSELPPPPSTPQEPHGRAVSGESPENFRRAAGEPPETLRTEGKGGERIGGEGSKDMSEPPASDATPSAEVRSDNPQFQHLAGLLADLIEGNGSKRPTEHQIAKWRNDVRLMIEQDGRSVEQIESAVRWSQRHDFWRTVVLSMPKLRAKWDQMKLQASRAPKASNADETMAVVEMLREKQAEA